MSRIGKTPIAIPSGVTVTITEDQVTVNGPKGELSLALHPMVVVEQKQNEDGADYLELTLKDGAGNGAIWGTMRSLLNGMVTGVTEGWSKSLELNGVGFKMNVAGQKLTMSLGFSHEVVYQIPEGVTATIEGSILTLSGIDKALVGQTAAEIRSFKKPEPYKGKGLKYTDEIIRRKVGKAAKSE